MVRRRRGGRASRAVPVLDLVLLALERRAAEVDAYLEAAREWYELD